MDVRALRYFEAVAEAGSYSRGADVLRISQPAVSRQIRALEEELGRPLFVRHSHGVSLTEAGRLLVERSQSILRQMDQARADIRRGQDGPAGEVTLAVPPAAGTLLIPALTRRLAALYPNVVLRVSAYAEAMERDPSLVPTERSAAVLAHHWESAHEPARALPALLTAATRAGEQYAYAEQLRLLERALELWDRVPEPRTLTGLDHLALLELAMDAASKTDLPRGLAMARAAVAESDPVAEPERAALLLERRARLLRKMARPGGLEDLLAARDLLPEGPGLARASVLESLASAYMQQAQTEPSMTIALEARDTAVAVGDRNSEWEARITLGINLHMSGRIDDGIRELRAVLAEADRGRQPEVAMRVLINLADSLYINGALHEAAAVGLEGIDLARSIGRSRTYGAFCAGNAASALLDSGDADGAAAVLDAALALEPHGVQAVCLHTFSGLLLVKRGEIDAATRAARAARGVLVRSYAGLQFHLPLGLLEAEIALAHGDARSALASAEAALASAAPGQIPPLTWPLLVAAAQAVSVLARQGHAAKDIDMVRESREGAERLHARIELEPSSVGREPAFRATALALLTTTSPLPAWREAARLWEQSEDRESLARVALRLAEAAHAEGDERTCQSALARARELATRLGYVPVLTAVEKLTRLGVDIHQRRAALPGDGLGLTDREREVLSLVAAGHSNREIGEALFITAKTASVHVSNLMAKLQVSSRGEAAALAHRLRLFDAEAS